MIKAVLFDFIGTMVIEENNEVINNCFKKAFADNNVNADISVLKSNRGKNKKVILENVLSSQKLSLSLIETIYASFKKNIIADLSKFFENEGTAEIILYLREQQIKVGIGSGLERDIFESICQHLNWDTARFDYIGIADEIGRGRPFPDMIVDMMGKLNIKNANNVLKVGDTVADIQEGKNAKVITAVILSGTQTKEILLQENPDIVFMSLLEIKKVVEENNL